METNVKLNINFGFSLVFGPLPFLIKSSFVFSLYF
jgi:hypothetical protein